MVVSPMTKRNLRADFLTSSYRIVGEVKVGSSGFSGLLNDDAVSIIEVYSASMARAHLPGKLVDIYEVARLMKRQIIAVCLKRREDVGPYPLGLSGYTTPSNIPIWVTTDIFEIQGTLEWAGHFDFSALIGEGTRDFLPIYDATVTMILVPSVRIECPAMFINRRSVNTFSLVKQRQKWE